MLNQRHHPVITLLAVIMISVFSCQNTRIKQISDNAPILSLQLASSIHNNAVPDDEELDTLSEVTDISALQAQNKLLRQRSHFTTGGIAMILGVGGHLSIFDAEQSLEPYFGNQESTIGTRAQHRRSAE